MKSYKISQRYKYRGNLTWYGRIAEDGEFRYISLKTTRKSDAVDWLNMMNAARFLPETIRRKLSPKDRNIEESIPRFIEAVESNKNAVTNRNNTMVAYRYRLKAFSNWLEENGIKTFLEFDREKATDYVHYLSENYAPKTLHEMTRCTMQFCGWAQRIYDLGDYSPFDTVTLPSIPKRAKAFWTPEQIDRILDLAPSADYRLFWSLMAFAGLRHFEAYSFGKSSIVDGKLHLIGKGSKEAFLPISDRLQSEIKRYGKLTDGMFMISKFKHSERANDVLKKAVGAAGYKNDDATNHKWRHSFASNLIRSGVGVKQVQQLMRHEDIRQTLDTYSHLLQEDLKAALDGKGKKGSK